MSVMPEKKKKIYIIDNAQLMSDWDWGKNIDLFPHEISVGSDKKAWWKCSTCGYEWQARVANRANLGRGCPKCAQKSKKIRYRQTLLSTRDSLANVNLELSNSWHPTRNGQLTPNEVTPNSMKKVWWICANGHEWQAAINNRNQGKGCPYCAGQKVWLGFNDLATVRPDLTAEWHPSKNLPLTAELVTTHFSKKVWWRCSHGHEWQATVGNRAQGSSCPYCSGRMTIPGETDLATTNPEIAAEWHPIKNGVLLPNMFSSGAHKRVWWKCALGHEWQAAIYSRRQSGCPVCSAESKTSFPEQAIYFYLKKITEAQNRHQIQPRVEIDVYLPELKIGIEYDGIYFHKGIISDEREKRKDELLRDLGIILLRVKELDSAPITDATELTIYCIPCPNSVELNRVINLILQRINEFTNNHFTIDVDVDRDRGKIYTQYIESEKENSLLHVNPELAAQWHPHNNEGLTPNMVTANSNKKVWWLCEEGHEWQAVVASRNKGNGCPYCSGFLPIKGKTDLLTQNPKLALQWNPDRNGKLTPSMFSVNSNKRVWWKCEKGHEWKANINSRNYGTGCPYCANVKVLVGYNDLTTTNPEIIDEWHPTKNEKYVPTMYVAGSDKRVWWKCRNCGFEWEMQIKKRTKLGRGCPQCRQEKRR